MKPICVFFALLFLPGTMRAQTTGQDYNSSAADNTNLASEVKALREALQQTQRQLANQQREIETLKEQSKTGSAAMGTNRPSPTEGETGARDSASSPLPPAPAITRAYVGQQPTAQSQEQAKSQIPLGSIKLGDAILTLGGFVDFENIFRTTNTQSNIATNFGGIPYNNTAQGRVTELRTTAQFSRLSVKITEGFHGNDITGYVEGDFGGNDAPGVFQSVNPHTNRLRLYFVDLRRGKWEFLAG